MTRTRKTAALSALMLLLAACGNTTTERAATGALGGAIAGEVIADEPLAGAALGGLGGALIRR